MSQVFEISLAARGVLMDADLPVASDNLQYIVDKLVINGVTQPSLDASKLHALVDAIASLVEAQTGVS